LRYFSLLNMCLWCVLFVAWIPYLALTGFGDRVSVEVLWILAVTAGLQLLLVGMRARARRPLLG
jgi:hypothetical protein